MAFRLINFEEKEGKKEGDSDSLNNLLASDDSNKQGKVAPNASSSQVTLVKK